ncbi:MAG: hypothetical protein K2Y37_09875 [Pirellulales bacterium]|nr:hypothetical protein [Pirellulales bacterium]
MKTLARVLLGGLMIGLLGPAVAVAEDKVTPVGDWQLEVATPDGVVLNLKVNIKQDGDNYKGTMVGDDGVESELTDIAFKDDELKFALSRDFGGQQLTSKFTGKLTAEKFEGSVDYDIGGQAGTLEVTGGRPKLDLTGTWLLVATSEGGVFEPKLHLKHDGETLEGKYEWNEDVTAEIKDGKIVDGEITFTVTHDFNGEEIVVKYKVKLDGEKLAGSADYDLAGQTGTAEIEGSRGKPVKVAGTWNITIAGENGETYETVAKLTQEGDALSGTYEGPAGEAKISDAKLEGNKLSFAVARERDGQKLVLNYKGTLDGDTMKGEVEFDFGGETRTTTFEAKRAE